MLKYLLFTIFLVSLIAIGTLMKSGNINYVQHDQVGTRINMLQKYDEELNEHLIKINSSLHFSFDILNKTTLEIASLKSSLKLETSMLDSMLSQKFDRIEHFKSDYSVFRNSLKTLPAIAHQINNQAPHINLNFLDIVLSVLEYNNSPEQGQKETLMIIIKRLEEVMETETDKELVTQIGLFVYHSYTILNLKGSIDKTLNDILKIRTDVAFNQLLLSHNNIFKVSNDKNRSAQHVLLTIALLMFFGMMYFLSKSEKNKTKLQVLINNQETIITQRTNELSIKNKQITDSIKYAKRIQEAILPTPSSIANIFPEFFLIYKPKDIVSGDFYWVHEDDKYIYLAVADCTGHGVPGGFLSMLSYNALNNAIKTIPKANTGDLLNFVDGYIYEKLNAHGVHQMSEGLDISLIRKEKNSLHLQFSGARNNLLIRQNEKIEIIKANRSSIGEQHQYHQTHHFTCVDFNVQEDTIIYMTSDGYIDQMGGQQDKRIGSRRFKEMLDAIGMMKLQDQEQHLLNFFEEWILSANEEQMDDVTILAFKV